MNRLSTFADTDEHTCTRGEWVAGQQVEPKPDPEPDELFVCGKCTRPFRTPKRMADHLVRAHRWGRIAAEKRLGIYHKERRK